MLQAIQTPSRARSSIRTIATVALVAAIAVATGILTLAAIVLIAFETYGLLLERKIGPNGSCVNGASILLDRPVALTEARRSSISLDAIEPGARAVLRLRTKVSLVTAAVILVLLTAMAIAADIARH